MRWQIMDYVREILVSCFSNTLFLVFLIAVVGYLIGSIEIKGISLGSAGVFLIALLFGHFGFADNSLLHEIGLVTADSALLKTNLSIIQSVGLLCFVTSVGFIAGPNFFHNLKKNAKSYVLMAVIIIGSASLACAVVIAVTGIDSAMAVGLLSGALTTTPGFAAAQEIVKESEVLLNEVTIGYAVGYPFGVIGVVMFVQMIPKLLKADIAAERQKMNVEETERKKPLPESLYALDPIGVAPFALAIVLGIILGKLSFPLPGGNRFSLGNTGGPLLMGLLLGYFQHMGKIDMRISNGFLKAFREFGLILFLIGAGVPGGAGFAEAIQEHGFILFVYGAFMTILPLVLGYLAGKYVMKLCLLNNLGSITGGMTSTPALGTLINTAKTDDIAASYAATYPAALILVVLAAQFILTFM